MFVDDHLGRGEYLLDSLLILLTLPLCISFDQRLHSFFPVNRVLAQYLFVHYTFIILSLYSRFIHDYFYLSSCLDAFRGG